MHKNFSSIFQKKSGINLDVGCGPAKQKGFVGLDYKKGPGVDIVWNIEKTPWEPIPDQSCNTVLMSHVLEHVDPKYRFNVIEECWRILKPEGRLYVSCPLANSMLAHGHLEHYPCFNELAFQFFDPDYPLYHCRLPKTLPWRLLRNEAMPTGCIEIVMEPLKDKKGKPCWQDQAKYQMPSESKLLPKKIKKKKTKKDQQLLEPKQEQKTPEQKKFGDADITIVKSGANGNPRNRLLIVTPTLGKVRVEWAINRYNQVIPCNWTATSYSIGARELVPMYYLVADAQNLAVKAMIEGNYEWLLLWEDDTIAPIDAFCKLNQYIMEGDFPVVSGLYFLKGINPEPIMYRGRGNSAFQDWKLGDRVMCDGVPTGFLLIHGSVLRLMWEESEVYKTIGGIETRRVFETPSKVFFDPTGTPQTMRGTSDLYWCTRVINEKVLERAGWTKFKDEPNPFLVDTNIFCMHIDFDTGIQYPVKLPERFIKTDK